MGCAYAYEQTRRDTCARPTASAMPCVTAAWCQWRTLQVQGRDDVLGHGAACGASGPALRSRRCSPAIVTLPRRADPGGQQRQPREEQRHERALKAGHAPRRVQQLRRGREEARVVPGARGHQRAARNLLQRVQLSARLQHLRDVVTQLGCVNHPLLQVLDSLAPSPCSTCATPPHSCSHGTHPLTCRSLTSPVLHQGTTPYNASASLCPERPSHPSHRPLSPASRHAGQAALPHAPWAIAHGPRLKGPRGHRAYILAFPDSRRVRCGASSGTKTFNFKRFRLRRILGRAPGPARA